MLQQKNSWPVIASGWGALWSCVKDSGIEMAQGVNVGVEYCSQHLGVLWLAFWNKPTGKLWNKSTDYTDSDTSQAADDHFT